MLALPKPKRKFQDVDEIKQYARSQGSHWFDQSSMRFFASRIGNKVYKGKYFISSEQCHSSQCHCWQGNQFYCEPRKYSIRKVVVGTDRGCIETIGEFQQFNSHTQARKYIEKYLD